MASPPGTITPCPPPWAAGAGSRRRSPRSVNSTPRWPGPPRASRRATSRSSAAGWTSRRDSPWPISGSTPCTGMVRSPKFCDRSEPRGPAGGFRRDDMPLSQTSNRGPGQPPKTRIVILGGGFGGVTVAHHLERLCKRRRDVEIVLVSRDNFVVLTPLLFEVCSGALDARHWSFPIRAFLRTTRFVEAAVRGIDLEPRV